MEPVVEEVPEAPPARPTTLAARPSPPPPAAPQVARREEPVGTSSRDAERASRPVMPDSGDSRPASADRSERTMATLIPPVSSPPAVVPEPSPLREAPSREAPSTEAPSSVRALPPAETVLSSVDSLPRREDVIERQASVRGTIERYRSAYERLDAAAAQSVWPGVDAGALSRAFGSLESQQLRFEDCAIDVAGSTADATCTGRASVVPKIGGGRQSVNRTWRFRLEQNGESWTIASATVR